MKRKRTYSIALCLSAALSFVFSSCETVKEVASQTNDILINQGTTPTSSEISAGLKQALEIGLRQGVDQVSDVNGFFGNALIKIMFPPDAKKVETTLRSLGFNKLCDDAILALNRAAENASAKAAPIFMNALKQMTFNDAANILLGSDTAATGYFKRTTTDQLKAAFRPVIETSLSKAGATKYWTTIMTRYNQIPLVKPVNPDLSDYVTQRTIDGLFLMIADKEKQIREQLNARTTPLLKKVFGYAQRQKSI
jgi:hypothetical protein